jgi:hypothetical protein
MRLDGDGDRDPILNQSSEEDGGFVDLSFRISGLVSRGSYYQFRLTASYRGSTVGMHVVLRRDIKAGFNADVEVVKGHVYRSGVRFLRSGEESDRLVSAIGELYGLDVPQGVRMVDEETFTAFALHQGDIELAAEAVKLKIFGRDGEPFDEDAYYESFFNVDLPNRVVGWNEKDQEYREPLLRALVRG